MLFHCIAFAAVLVGPPPPHDLQAALRACARSGSERCDQLTVELNASFGGGSPDDRRLGATLAARLVGLMKRPTPALEAGVRACAAGECQHLGWVISQLFSGGDAALDRSPDRVLAHAFANALLGEQPMATTR